MTRWNIRSGKSWPLIRDLVIAEGIAYGVFLIIALSAHWALMYRKLAMARYISFTVVEFTILAAVQAALIIFVIKRSLQDEPNVGEMIQAGEHERLEFKTSLRWDVKQEKVNKELERGVMKTIAAFLNSKGGSLMIGVDDQRKIFGLEQDFASLPKDSRDGFENHFNNVFATMIGPQFRRLVRLSFHDFGGKNICLVQVDPAHQPAYLKTDRGEDFFIRTGNATTSLKMSEVATYVSAWRRR